MKLKFKPNIIIEKKKLKNINLNSTDLKNRIKYILSLVCDFSTELSIKFCDSEEMIQVNSSFRKKNYATDVLSFPNTMPQEDSSYVYLGDILICVPVCIEQAKKAKHTLSNELEKMLIHGIVHLKGFDHERNMSAFRVMSALEKAIQTELVKELKKPKWCSTGEK
jgi:probable rRNA maturation factor